jgi:predicted DNA binding protein
MGVDVRAVGEYLAGRIDERLELTQRQLDAVEAAVETGYYSATREATMEAVADRLDCAPGTAAELLRRAERTVMSAVVAGGPF